MDITIETPLSEKIAVLKFGILEYHNIIVENSPVYLKGKLHYFQESLFFDLENQKIGDIPEIKEWRQIFKTLGKSPSRYRPSAESLLRRVQKQQYLNDLHSAADLNNFFSLKYAIPIGLYDIDKIQGNVQLGIGNAQETYDGLNGRENRAENLLVVKDQIGPFGSPFVDSIRTAVTEKTTSALQIVYFTPSITNDAAEEMLKLIASSYYQVLGGTSKSKLITN
ncbi:tRNA synthetase subunit beta [Virgibacillus soli]|uniref:tRNA synthetase subunit beta n=1 Tax=Lederbergia galactosidilytica TaxID=217031 RepID=A0A0Q9XWS4_9BACI|nr:tRNA synthetase subunit beta [Lederbergia galactosidilytica]KRG16597.1 tRNA synthetase subunit beta [Virgibacillus soli]